MVGDSFIKIDINQTYINGLVKKMTAGPGLLLTPF